MTTSVPVAESRSDCSGGLRTAKAILIGVVAVAVFAGAFLPPAVA
jgi:hypothetical protein